MIRDRWRIILKKRDIPVLAAGLIVLVILSGCYNVNISPQVESRQGYVIVSFTTVVTSIAPPLGMDFDDYVFNFYKANSNTPTVFHKSKDESFIFPLDKGTTYTLKVTAKKKGNSGETLTAEGVSGSFEVDAATIVDVKLNTLPGEGPDGTFSCFIEYPENATIDELILQVDESNKMDLTAGADAGTKDGDRSISKSVDLKSGLYFLTLHLSMDGKEASYANGVEIYSGQSTYFGTSVDPIVLNPTDFKANQDAPAKYIALTYDDVGPGDYEDTTRSCLAMLDSENAKATFFVEGTIHPNCEQSIRDMYAEGYEIGNHAETHQSFYTYNVLTQEIENTDARIGEVLGIPGFKTKYFRPPYDNQSFDNKGNSIVEAAARDLGKPVIMWDLSTYDFVEGITVPDIYEIIVSCAATNSNPIILMHIQNYQAVVAAYFAINYLRSQGYEFVTVSEYLARKGIDAQPGQVIGSQQN